VEPALQLLLGWQKVADPEIAATVICDDVRQEVNGKQIIIGVYGNRIVVSSMPFGIPISIWMEFDAKKLGKNSFQVKISYSTGFETVIRVDLDIYEIGSIGIATPPILVSGAADGQLTVEVSNDGKKWKVIKRKAIQRGTITSLQSIASAPTF
jgi:hypothetical protein